MVGGESRAGFLQLKQRTEVFNLGVGLSGYHGFVNSSGFCTGGCSNGLALRPDCLDGPRRAACNGRLHVRANVGAHPRCGRIDLLAQHIQLGLENTAQVRDGLAKRGFEPVHCSGHAAQGGVDLVQGLAAATDSAQGSLELVKCRCAGLERGKACTELGNFALQRVKFFDGVSCTDILNLNYQYIRHKNPRVAGILLEAGLLGLRLGRFQRPFSLLCNFFHPDVIKFCHPGVESVKAVVV